MKKSINLRLDPKLLSELDAYAKELERTRTYLIEKAITSYFDKLDEIIADRRIDEIKKGKEKPVTLEEVLKKSGVNV
ncbi:MAG: ribbon-helix-helix protein, CopG family [Chlorobi bacterium]|nr:ribbon-helix-helix protein, CopG family [Chlorobiota bacterium]